MRARSGGPSWRGLGSARLGSRAAPDDGAVLAGALGSEQGGVGRVDERIGGLPEAQAGDGADGNGDRQIADGRLKGGRSDGRADALSQNAHALVLLGAAEQEELLAAPA